MLDNGIPVRITEPERPGRAVGHRRASSVPIRPRRPHRDETLLVASKPSDPRHYAAYLAVAASILLLVGAVWLSSLLRPSAAWHDLALFAHLASLVLGLGAVLVADYFFALWAFGRATLAEAVRSTSRLHLLVWAGLAGLIASGTVLKPDLDSPATLVKLGFVLVLTVNGVHAMVLGKRMAEVDGQVPRRLLVQGGLTTALSQICWWGAVVIGFLNANR